AIPIAILRRPPRRIHTYFLLQPHRERARRVLGSADIHPPPARSDFLFRLCAIAAEERRHLPRPPSALRRSSRIPWHSHHRGALLFSIFARMGDRFLGRRRFRASWRLTASGSPALPASGIASDGRSSRSRHGTQSIRRRLFR